MSAKLELDLEQLKKLINQLTFNEKEKLARYLDNQTLFLKLKQFMDSKKDIPITYEEITEEVEKVREEMYSEGSS
jgi:hypothetical protein